MTHEIKRCKHCGDKYTFQGSGEGCHHPENHREYCPPCITAINETLKKIPVKYKKMWVNSPDIGWIKAKTILRVDRWRRFYVMKFSSLFSPEVVWQSMLIRVVMRGQFFRWNNRDYILNKDGTVSQEIWCNAVTKEPNENLENHISSWRRNKSFRSKLSQSTIDEMFGKKKIPLIYRLRDLLIHIKKKIKPDKPMKPWTMRVPDDSIYFIDNLRNFGVGPNSAENTLMEAMKKEHEARLKNAEKLNSKWNKLNK